MEHLLRITGVSRSFPGVKALDGVTFDVVAGEVHGLVGENGAGKSTLMAVASGALAADEGTVEIGGRAMRADPELARDLGLAIVRQEPSLMPDLTVAENLYLGMPEKSRPALSGLKAWAANLLRRWSRDVALDVGTRVASLNPEQRFIVEIVKALATEPKVLVLDEPTEHLAAEDVGRLFQRIREVTARGAAVVYISHRIREVQEVADRLTVLRDGQGQGTYEARSLSEDQIVELIVGSSLDREFPPKAGSGPGAEIFRVEGFGGRGFSDVSLTVRCGEIVGLAGIDANGQREFMRALAGLNRSRGQVSVNGRSFRIDGPKAATAGGIRYLPGDRHREGIFADLTVRENFSLRSLGRDAVGSALINNGSERRRSAEAVERFAVKTPDVETPIGSLSGGNQQKLVLASVLAAEPAVLLVDEPTQGVDVGARMEIYRILRETAAKGTAIIVVSSDASEVAGLCDRVVVFSRGRVVKALEGDEVLEHNITSAVLTATSVRDRVSGSVDGFWRWASGNVAPLVTVGLAILLLGAYASSANEFYLSTRNMGGMMLLVATLALVAYGQQALMLVGGIDLSVGPLIGLVQVLASFFLLPDVGAAWQVTGWGVILCVAVLVGLVNWTLVEPIGLHPMVATLATFMAIQAISLLLRPVPDGMIDEYVMDAIGMRMGFVPLTLVAAVAIALGLEYLLYRKRIGLFFRGLGSRPEAARVAGVPPRVTRLVAYVGCSVLAAVAAVTLISQVGIGDPRAGLNYTLASIAAVIIGGASLFGGRGSFVGALFGAALITQVNTVTTFLNLDVAWQSYLLGGMILVAVALYSKSRQMAVMA